MSGPIIRKYGFPNFEKIFGAREIKHGGDEPAQSKAESPGTDPPPTAPADEGTPPGKDATPAQQASEDSAQL